MIQFPMPTELQKQVDDMEIMQSDVQGMKTELKKVFPW